ncbi:MAG: OmpA family protein [Bacteroidetes bacterium]|nr:OmpA family protein [Bacteroidota bacterium]
MKANLNILILILFVINNSAAQDILKDPGFEIMSRCPSEYTEDRLFGLVYWEQPTAGTTDFFHQCSYMMGVPENYFGNLSARSGTGYAGFIAFNSKDVRKDYREYLTTELEKPLVKGQKYCVKVYVSLADIAGYACDGIGIHFSVKKPRRRDYLPLHGTPQVNNQANKILLAHEWTEVGGVYIATGLEQYLTIGNFKPDNETNYLLVKERGVAYAYYYVDDISIVPFEDAVDCPHQINSSYINLASNTEGVEAIMMMELMDVEDEYLVSQNEIRDVEDTDSEESAEIIFAINELALVEDEQQENERSNADIEIPNINLSASVTLAYEDSDVREELNDSISFEDIEVADIFKLNNIYFESDRSSLLPESYLELNLLFEILVKYPSIVIEGFGHTDSTGGELRNQRLSEARSKAVMDYLISRNIIEKRMINKGYGQQRPIATNSTDAGKQLNRRVEIKILKK